MTGLTGPMVQKARAQLKGVTRPLIFFHDDADGLASFLLMYRAIGEGKGVVIKSQPVVQEAYLRKVQEYSPDKVFVLDLASVDAGFLQKVSTPVVWIDHHEVQQEPRAAYFNPRHRGPEKNTPASYACYQIVQQDMWIAMAGIVGDWFLSPLAREFSKKYPDLLPPHIKTPQEALFTTRIGELAQVFNFLLKGTAQDAMKYARVMTRIRDPYEILDRATRQGNYIYKKYRRFKKEYDELLEDAEHQVTDSPLLFFRTPQQQTAFSGELSNELLFRYPDKIICIARQHKDVIRCSLRSSGSSHVHNILQNALVGIDGSGGGHEHACGCSINERDFDRFFKNLESETRRMKG